jgi:hypothetical protein
MRVGAIRQTAALSIALWRPRSVSPTLAVPGAAFDRPPELRGRPWTFPAVMCFRRTVRQFVKTCFPVRSWPGWRVCDCGDAELVRIERRRLARDPDACSIVVRGGS